MADNVDLTALMTFLGERFDRIDHRFEQIDQRFEQIDQRFERIDQRFERIDQRFDRMEGQVNQRFDAMEAELHDLGSKIATVGERVHAIEGHLMMEPSLGLILARLKTIEQSQRDLSSRVTQLER